MGHSLKTYGADKSAMYLQVTLCYDRWYEFATRKDAWFVCWLNCAAASFHPSMIYPHSYGVMDDFGTLVYVK